MAQQVLPVVDRFTHVWRYDDSGRDLGTAWRTNSYEDSAWPTGAGLFGAETAVPFPYAPAGFPGMTAPLNLTPPGSNTQTVTFYFRTRFHLPVTNLNGIVLLATNFLDDGAVLFLNGMEAGRFRVPTNQNFRTITTTLATEGQADVFTLATALLRPGDNTLAAEVHQVSPTQQTDVAFAMSVTALVPETLQIARAPQDRTNVVGTSATFEVTVAGGPVNYQWYRNSVPIPGARTNAFTIPSVAPSDAGSYTVLVSNVVSSTVSPPATLTIIPDTFGPKLVSAVVNEAGQTNRIIVVFSERLLDATAINPDNYRLTRSATGTAVGLSNVAHLAGAFSQVQLLVGGPEWVLGEDYVLTVNGVRDFTSSNRIAPDSQIGVGWPQSVRVLVDDSAWEFHTAAAFDPDVFNTPWWTPEYIPGPWWAQGPGAFSAGLILTTPCIGPFRTVTGFQYEPSLFRATFAAPHLPDANLRLRLRAVFNDGMVLFLNGAEVWRTNLPSGPLHAAVPALAQVSGGLMCSTLTLPTTAFRPGLNTVAAAIFQANPAGGDTAFGLQIDALYERTSPVPPSPTPELRITASPDQTVSLTWSGTGFALESSPTLDDTNSTPIGPWTEVADMTNPYLIPPETIPGQRFYRLRK